MGVRKVTDEEQMRGKRISIFIHKACPTIGVYELYITAATIAKEKESNGNENAAAVTKIY